MSKFIDRLKQLAEGTPQPIGFRLGMKSNSRLRMQLIGLISGNDHDIKTNEISGADAVILGPTAKLTAESVSSLVQDNAEKPLGMHFSTGMVSEVKSLIEAGTDFAIFSPDLPISVVTGKSTGKILNIDPSQTDTRLRTVNGLAVDAVLAGYQFQNSAVTWQDLIEIQRLTGIINKPFLLNIPANITANELQSLWNAGVDGVIVDITTDSAATLKQVRDIISKLEFPDNKQREQLTPSVPRMAAETAVKKDDEEEEEEDDE